MTTPKYHVGWMEEHEAYDVAMLLQELWVEEGSHEGDPAADVDGMSHWLASGNNKDARAIVLHNQHCKVIGCLLCITIPAIGIGMLTGFKVERGAPYKASLEMVSFAMVYLRLCGIDNVQVTTVLTGIRGSRPRKIYQALGLIPDSIVHTGKVSDIARGLRTIKHG